MGDVPWPSYPFVRFSCTCFKQNVIDVPAEPGDLLSR